MSCLVTSIFSLGECAVLPCNPEGKQMVNLMVISVFKKYIFLKIHVLHISKYPLIFSYGPCSWLG